MAKLIGLALLLLLVVPVPPAAGQRVTDKDRERIVQEQERAFFERAKKLHRSIQPGWSPQAVASIMGPPEVVGRGNQGRDDVETWWYHGYEVGIEFTNGYVSKWFFRFMLR